MKIDRLMGIVVYLLNNGAASARMLAEEFEVSPRTIMRDMEALDRAGIPVRACPGKSGGYRLMEDFVLDRQTATGQDYGWIVTALKGLASGYQNRDLERTLAKLQGFAGGIGTVSMDIGAASENEAIRSRLALLESAIAQRRVVGFSYTNARDETRYIHVEPVRLQYKWYNWYLIAYYERHRDYCMFKLARMENLEVSGEVFSRTHDPEAIVLRDSREEIVHVRLRGKPCVRSRCLEYLNGTLVREFDNGDFEYSFSAPAHEAFWFGALLSMGSNVRIIEPAQLRDRIVAVCWEILAEYEEGDEYNEGDYQA